MSDHAEPDPGDEYRWWPGGAPTHAELEWASRLLDLVDDYDHRSRYSQWEINLAMKVAIIAKRKASTAIGGSGADLSKPRSADLISICVPSRGRPDRFQTMVESAFDTANGEIEVCGVLDEDDPQLADYPVTQGVRYMKLVSKPAMSHLWNFAAHMARGPIYMMGADDLVFQTQGWDTMVTQAFDAFSDKILLVWCSDGTEHATWATHPFVHEEWIAATGQFTPKHFEAWYADAWLLDIALKVGRTMYLPDHVIEHQHVNYGTAPDDETYEMRRAYQPTSWPVLSERPEWAVHERERMRAAERLQAGMDPHVITPTIHADEYRALGYLFP